MPSLSEQNEPSLEIVTRGNRLADLSVLTSSFASTALAADVKVGKNGFALKVGPSRSGSCADYYNSSDMPYSQIWAHRNLSKV